MVAVVFLGRVELLDAVELVRHLRRARLPPRLFGAQGGFLGGRFGLFGEQGLAVLLRDLVIVGVDFAEGRGSRGDCLEIDECRLQRRFDPGYLCKVDIAFDLLVFSGVKSNSSTRLPLSTAARACLPVGAHRSACGLPL